MKKMAIKAIEFLIKEADAKLVKAIELKDYSNAATNEAYKNGLEMALEVVKIAKE